MGVFSEIAMEQQNSMFDSSAAFEDDEAFELEEMESLPVPPVGTDTVPVAQNLSQLCPVFTSNAIGRAIVTPLFIHPSNGNAKSGALLGDPQTPARGSIFSNNP